MVRFAPVVLFLCVWHPASAYVRTITKNSKLPVLWTTHCVTLIPDARASRAIPYDQFETALVQAATNWTDRIDGCTFMRLSVLPGTITREVENDGQPIVTIRDDQWSRPGKDPHDRSAIGLTTVFFITSPGQPGDGFILDADVELNNVFFTLTTSPQTARARPGTQVADLENTLTHELGHVLGLGHTCYVDDGVNPRPNDNAGKAVPDCFPGDTLPALIKQATMYPFSETPGEIEKRSLSADDIAGVCETYPIGNPATGCERFIEGGYPVGCSFAPGAPAEVSSLSAADSALSAGDLEPARARYTEALAAGGELARLGSRGLGDIAMRERRFAQARSRYRAALDGATGVLAIELREKHALAERRLRQQYLAWAAWTLYALALAWFVLRTARAREHRFPIEIVYAAPIYALMCLGAVGRDPEIARTLIIGAVASAVLIALSGLATPRHPIRQMVALAVANLALFYAALHAGGLLDRIS